LRSATEELQLQARNLLHRNDWRSRLDEVAAEFEPVMSDIDQLLKVRWH
jgi:hypothetical protein